MFQKGAFLLYESGETAPKEAERVPEFKIKMENKLHNSTHTYVQSLHQIFKPTASPDELTDHSAAIQLKWAVVVPEVSRRVDY